MHYSMENTKRFVISVPNILFLFFAAIFASSDHTPDQKEVLSTSKHFVLVHGSCFGAWSWHKLEPLLKSVGHMVTAIDLGASGINLLHATDVRSFSDYTKPLMALMESIPSNQRVILVGHSSGGAVISQAMEHFPGKVAVGVFLSAIMPGPSFNYSALAQKVMSKVAHALDNKFDYGKGLNNPPTAFLFGPKFLSQVVFHHSPPEDAALATYLVRPKPLVSGNGLILSTTKYGSVRGVLIVSEEDMIVTQDVVDYVIKKNPPSKIFRIGRSDHMAMDSQPAQLCTYLLSIARDYC